MLLDFKKVPDVLKVENKELSSVFQPIYSFSNQACIGVEALVRGKVQGTDLPVSVYECLRIPANISKSEFWSVNTF